MGTKLVTRTHFKKSITKNQDWQWFWTTKTPDEQDNVAVGGEGYDNLTGAQNGFFSSQGDIDWAPGDPMPAGYVIEKFSPVHYTISKFVTDEETGEE